MIPKKILLPVTIMCFGFLYNYDKIKKIYNGIFPTNVQYGTSDEEFIKYLYEKYIDCD
jgi:hypothetical protein